MMLRSSFSTFFFLTLFEDWFTRLQGSEICNPEVDEPVSCTDTTGSTGYCCFQDKCTVTMELSECLTCCYRTEVWLLWYFWFGIFIVVVLLGSLIMACINKRQKKEATQSRRQNSELSGTTRESPIRMSNIESKKTDDPPLYEELHINDSNTKTKELAEVSSVQSYCPTYEKALCMPTINETEPSTKAPPTGNNNQAFVPEP